MWKNLKALGLKTHLCIHYLACFLGAVIMMTGCYISQSFILHPLVYLGIVILAFGLVWRILFIKCPHCSSGLYNWRSASSHCPDCGKELY